MNAPSWPVQCRHVVSYVERLAGAAVIEPFLPVIFSLYGAVLLSTQEAPGWQWMFLSLIACMSLVGARDSMRTELIAWRYLTLAFTAVVFLVFYAGLGSGFVVYLYTLAFFYPRHIRQLSIVATTTAIAAGFAIAEYWVIGISMSLMHVAGVFAAGWAGRQIAGHYTAHEEIDPYAISVLRIRADDPRQEASNSMLSAWRGGVTDYLGEDVVMLTTANRELAVLLPDLCRSRTESIAETLRYRFSALALPPAAIQFDTINTQRLTPVTTQPLSAVSR